MWYILQTIVNGIINLNAILLFARRLQTYPFEGNQKSSKDARNQCKLEVLFIQYKYHFIILITKYKCIKFVTLSNTTELPIYSV